MSKKIAVIGVGNMAKSIISGILRSNMDLECFNLFDVNPEQYNNILSDKIISKSSIFEAVSASDTVLLSVKPQNFPEVLSEIVKVPNAAEKLYISIGAGVTVSYLTDTLKTSNVVRVLPNLPMLISKGVSVICYNDFVKKEDFDFVVDIFKSSGSVIKIDEKDMNKTIGITSSSPAYVFKFIKAICDGANAQGIDNEDLINTVCDVLIGSAELIKSQQSNTPDDMIKAVASKGGTTEKALEVLDKYDFEAMIAQAMLACTQRADELGKIK